MTTVRTPECPFAKVLALINIAALTYSCFKGCPTPTACDFMIFLESLAASSFFIIFFFREANPVLTP